MMRTTSKISKYFVLSILTLVFACSSDDNSDADSGIDAQNLVSNFDENPTNGDAIGTIQASSSNTLSYSIDSQTPDGAMSIDATTGALTVADATLFDFETNPVITASISIVDPNNTATATATINLNDIKDVIFIHTADTSNTSGNVTYLDHPDLNGNPNAIIVISHNWNGGTYNDNVSGVWYDSSQQKWSIFNENINTIVSGSTYNVYIVRDGVAFTHIATNANQGIADEYTRLDHPEINGDSEQNLVFTNYWNPNSVYNDFNYSVWYEEGNQNKWNLFTEDFSAIPDGAAFNVLVKSDGGEEYTHQATASNINGNYTIIDHPSLNNNPNAKFVFSHNWKIFADSGNVVLDKTLSLWYTGTNWSIYTEDLTTMPENIKFDLVILN